MSSHSHLLVQQLLQAEAAAERRARWEASDAQTLELEIAKYKQALAGVLGELNRLGERAAEAAAAALPVAACQTLPPPPPLGCTLALPPRRCRRHAPPPLLRTRGRR